MGHSSCECLFVCHLFPPILHNNHLQRKRIPHYDISFTFCCSRKCIILFYEHILNIPTHCTLTEMHSRAYLVATTFSIIYVTLHNKNHITTIVDKRHFSDKTYAYAIVLDTWKIAFQLVLIENCW